MSSIEQLLVSAGVDFTYVSSSGSGIRVAPHESCYAKDLVMLTSPETRLRGDVLERPIWCVQCAAPMGTSPELMIGHRHSGDPGYCRPPYEFMSASSIGQVISALARVDRLPCGWPPAYTPAAGRELLIPGEIYYGPILGRTSAWAPLGWGTVRALTRRTSTSPKRVVSSRSCLIL
jgi:hypothetical protein